MANTPPRVHSDTHLSRELLSTHTAPRMEAERPRQLLTVATIPSSEAGEPAPSTSNSQCSELGAEKGWPPAVVTQPAHHFPTSLLGVLQAAAGGGQHGLQAVPVAVSSFAFREGRIGVRVLSLLGSSRTLPPGQIQPGFFLAQGTESQGGVPSAHLGLTPVTCLRSNQGHGVQFQLCPHMSSTEAQKPPVPNHDL